MIRLNKDCDENNFKESVLPLNNFDSYDQNIPPKTGQDYLRRVQLEEKNYPDVLIKDLKEINIKKKILPDPIKKSQDFFYLDTNNIPNEEWQDGLLFEFSNIRLKVDKLRKENISFLELKYINYSNLNFSWWKSIFENNEELPLIKKLLEYPQDHIENGLKFITKYLKQSKKFNTHIGKWIYGLLACLEFPLQSDFYSTLRNLSCVCSYLRTKYPFEEKIEHEICTENDNLIHRSLNIVIYIIGKYFKQFDLVDGYNN